MLVEQVHKKFSKNKRNLSFAMLVVRFRVAVLQIPISSVSQNPSVFQQTSSLFAGKCRTVPCIVLGQNLINNIISFAIKVKKVFF